MKSEKKPRKPDFDSTYSEIYGPRWPSLRAALLLDHPKAALSLPGGAYHLDAASLEVVRALQLAPGERVLDLCAAPGGKTLAIACALSGESSCNQLGQQAATSVALVSNERSADRRGRLKRVLAELLPESLAIQVRVTGHDATRWGLHEQNIYDAVLLDAPCSSEAHVLRDPKALAQWSPSRIERLATQQFAMLASALEAARVGGRIVYATCALSPAENDGVIEKLHRKRAGRFEIESLAITPSGGEPTEYGWQILPDRAKAGPMYFCRIRKLA